MIAGTLCFFEMKNIRKPTAENITTPATTIAKYLAGKMPMETIVATITMDIIAKIVALAKTKPLNTSEIRPDAVILNDFFLVWLKLYRLNIVIPFYHNYFPL